MNLGQSLRARRKRQKLTQTSFARMIHSNQARVARMENGDPSVSIDRLIKSLYTLGMTNDDLAEIISQAATVD
jgi:transcriptional regulator with XRE-family HTH domain